jgi:hypothetical protein
MKLVQRIGNQIQPLLEGGLNGFVRFPETEPFTQGRWNYNTHKPSPSPLEVKLN